MNLAQGLERRLEKLADGASATVFRGRMHPVDIATRLIRQLDFLTIETPAGPQVPNDLLVHMNPVDIDTTLDRDALTAELENAVTQTATERGWRLVGNVSIHIRTDAATPRGIVECAGTTVTASLEPWCQFIADDGSAVLTISMNRTLIGRALDCDIRIANQEISRHHLLVYREGSRIFVRDLGSSNGTFLDGVPVGNRAMPIVTGDSVILGDLSFTYRTIN